MPEEASDLRHVSYRHNKTFIEVQISSPAVLSSDGFPYTHRLPSGSCRPGCCYELLIFRGLSGFVICFPHFVTQQWKDEKETMKADMGRKLSSVGQDNSDCFMSFFSSCCKFTPTISCSPHLADGADPSVNISLITTKANLSCSFLLLSSSVTSCVQVYLTLHTLPVFLLYTDMQEIGTAILLLSRSWGLEPQALPWKCAGVVFTQY